MTQIDTIQQKLAVISPVGRESETIREFISCVHKNLFPGDFHVLVTDAFTDDLTMDIIRETANNRSNLIWHNLENSQGIASVYLAGYLRALELPVSLFLEIDSGFSHNPHEISLFREAADQFEVVFGNRFLNIGSYKTTIKRRVISKGGSLLARFFLRSSLGDLTSGYQLFSRGAITKILNNGVQATGPFFQTEMKYLACKFGFTFTEVPITYSNPSHLVKLADITDSLKSLFRLFLSK
jgi:dolichol-phosphate mannosyltransferase